MKQDYYLSKIIHSEKINLEDFLNFIQHKNTTLKERFTDKLPIIIDKLIRNNQFDDFLSFLQRKGIEPKVFNISFLKALVSHPLEFKKLLSFFGGFASCHPSAIDFFLQSLNYAEEKDIKALLTFYKEEKENSVHYNDNHHPDFYLLYSQYPSVFYNVYKLNETENSRLFFYKVLDIDVYAIAPIVETNKEFFKKLIDNDFNRFKRLENGKLSKSCENNLTYLFTYYPDVYQYWFDIVEKDLLKSLSTYINYNIDLESYCLGALNTNIFLESGNQGSAWSEKTDFNQWYIILQKLLLKEEETTQSLAMHLIYSFDKTIIIKWISQDILSENSVFNHCLYNKNIAQKVFDYWCENNCLNVDDPNIEKFFQKYISESSDFADFNYLSSIINNQNYNLDCYQKNKIISFASKKDLYSFLINNLGEYNSIDKCLTNNLKDKSLLSRIKIINLSILLMNNFQIIIEYVQKLYPDYQQNKDIDNLKEKKFPPWLRHPDILVYFLGIEEAENLIGYVDFVLTNNPKLSYKEALVEYLNQYSDKVFHREININKFDDQHNFGF